MIPASEAYIIPLEVVVKARTPSAAGERIVEVEASSEAVDAEGDIVLQKALLDSADEFIRAGHIDLEHISEIGHRIGIRDPSSYIVGRPLEVKDLGGKRTGVVSEIMRSKSGAFEPEQNKYDAFWKSLQSEPPVKWSASIYGFPTEIDDCSEKACTSGATRYVIKSINWRSLAFTRNPVNRSLRGNAKVITAKAMVAAMEGAIGKDFMSPFGLSQGMAELTQPPLNMNCGAGGCPKSMDALWGNYQRHNKTCEHLKGGNSVVTFKDHFIKCCGADPEMADLLSHALMYMILRNKRK
jgi:hypothetical protein